MYAQEAMNLALAYPYLAPLLDKFVFERYWHDGLKPKIGGFLTSLVKLGTYKLYPDTIAHALYFALKYDVTIDLKDDALIEIIALDDCITNVLLLEYAKRHKRWKVNSKINRHAKNLIAGDSREKDRHWLLIYQVCSSKQLEGNGQGFLAMLKRKKFRFFYMPERILNKAVEAVAHA